MTCPDENVFAELQAGLLETHEVAGLAEHLASCQRCNELLALMSHTRGFRGGGPHSEPGMPALPKPGSAFGRARGHYRLAQLLMTFLHACWALSMLSLFIESRKLAEAELASAAPLAAGADGSPWILVLAGLAAFWGPVGLLGSVATTVGLYRARPWARRACLGLALLSLPTLCMTPLAVVVLITFTRPAAQRELAGR